MRRLLIKRNLFLFVFILFISLSVASLLFIGEIDQDFFSFYYIGRGLNQGLNMYRDFPENKGPIFYIFMAFLYRLFRSNYSIAVFFANGFIDAISIFFLCKLLEKKQLFRLPTKRLKDFLTLKKLKDFLTLFFLILYYKSFSIGMYLGGFYSETLAFCFLLICLYQQENKADFWSGFFFALACLCRPTVVFFFLYILIRYLFSEKPQKKMVFLASAISAGLVVMTYLFIKGDLYYFFKNQILLSLIYPRTVKDKYFSTILYTSILELRIFLSLIFVTFVGGGYLLNQKNKKKEKTIFISLLISSLASTFVGGVFYFHHFVQFTFLVIFCWFILVKFWSKSPLRNFFSFTIVIYLVVGCLCYFFSDYKWDLASRIFLDRYLNGPDSKKYLFVFPHYSKFYFDYNKEAPDRYFQFFYLSSVYNQAADTDREIHSKADRERIKNTVFLFISRHEVEQSLKEEYLGYFKEKFGLNKIDSYQKNSLRLEIYYADPPGN